MLVSFQRMLSRHLSMFELVMLKTMIYPTPKTTFHFPFLLGKSRMTTNHNLILPIHACKVEKLKTKKEATMHVQLVICYPMRMFVDNIVQVEMHSHKVEALITN